MINQNEKFVSWYDSLIEEGVEKGMAKGIEKSVELEKRKTEEELKNKVIKAFKKGYDIETISSITELSIAEVEAILKNASLI